MCVVLNLFKEEKEIENILGKMNNETFTLFLKRKFY